MGQLLLEVVVVLLAAASVTRLIAADTISHPARVWLSWKITRRARYVELAEWCRWCVGMWVSLLAAWLWWLASPVPHLFGPGLVDVLVVALALRYAIGLLASWER